MDKKTILLIFLIFLISIPQTSASEDIVIEYHRANLEGVGRYWFGQGELSASNLENPFTLRANGNEIISYSSNATLISLTENEIQFSSTEATNNHAHALFMAGKPIRKGSGVYALEISLPYISNNIDRNVTLTFEDCGRILYLNGPVYFEGQQFNSGTNYKTVHLENVDTDLQIIFLTNSSYNVLPTILMLTLFSFILFVMIFFRRTMIIKSLEQKIHGFVERMPISVRESDGIEIILEKKPVPADSSGKNEENNYQIRDTVGFKVSKEIFAFAFVLLLLFIALKSIVDMLSGFFDGMGIFEYIISFMLFLIAIMMLTILITAKSQFEFNNLMSIFVGGIMAVLLFNIAGFIVIPIALIAVLAFYSLNKKLLLKQRQD